MDDKAGKIRRIPSFAEPPKTEVVIERGMIPTISEPVTVQEFTKYKTVNILDNPVYYNAILMLIGGVILLVGIWHAGTFYFSSTRLEDDLANFWYVMQMATMFEIVGSLIFFPALWRMIWLMEHLWRR